MRMDDPIESCFGVGLKTAGRFHRLGILTVSDLLRHYPARYDMMPPVSDISGCIEGKTAAVLCKVDARPVTVST